MQLEGRDNRSGMNFFIRRNRWMFVLSCWLFGLRSSLEKLFPGADVEVLMSVNHDSKKYELKAFGQGRLQKALRWIRLKRRIDRHFYFYWFRLGQARRDAWRNAIGNSVERCGVAGLGHAFRADKSVCDNKGGVRCH